ncbi:unnamed protein product [Euphydryas editha]|uniref:Uncharacterized protein n=1 Tax=Euphydryas editha TaxID=104508 RepID=A0AAU9V1E5_EUPED|nr:unnamed protein product [Euphydryas editha]
MSFRNYYDSSSSYSRNRDTARTASVSTDRPATVTAKYTTTPSYKSSSIPVLNDRSSRDETPISAIANRYASYSKTTTAEKPSSKYEKKDYTKLSVPSVSLNRSRDVSPVSTTSKYSISRTSRHTSPERKTTKSFKEKSQNVSPIDRDKDIPNKTDKTTNYSSLSNYKLYPRTPSYSRPMTRVDSKPEVTVNRYAIANRLSSSSYLRSPTPVKRPSLSPVNHPTVNKTENDKSIMPSCINEEHVENKKEGGKECIQNGAEVVVDDKDAIETISVITRHTSPTPPGSSAYVRMRRADMAKTIEKITTRPKKRPEMVDKEIQSDRLDDPTRSSRFASTSRTSMTNWTYYSPNVNSYTGYAGRYSTQYSNLRDNATCNDRSSRSRSKEPIENTNVNTGSDDKDTEILLKNNHLDSNEDLGDEQNKDETEIIINVNLKLQKRKSPQPTATEVSSEITITNNHQLPPQPPKSENTSKIKKIKIRKSSTDSSSDSTSSKKIVKKRSKSVSSTDSEQSGDKSKKNKDSTKVSSKTVSKTPSMTNLPNGTTKLKSSKSRENNSPESSITLSTQSSISEDEITSNLKTSDSTKINNESSLSLEQVVKQSSHKSDGAEEAKSFLIRALAPVTNLFKLRHHDNSENVRLLENSNSESTNKDTASLINENGSTKIKNTNNIIASNDDNVVKLKAIRHIESGERAWWLESDSDKKQGLRQELSTENKDENQTSIQWSTSGKTDMKRSMKLNSFADDEKPWWLDSNANIPEGIERLTPPRKSSSDSDKSEKFNFFKMRHIESGDRKDWRVSNNENVLNKQGSQNSLSLSKSGSDQKSFPLRRIRHIESGERPWWLSSDKNIPEGIEKLPTPPPQEESDSSDSEEVEVYVPPSQIPPFPLHLPDDEPLGDRRSPEGLETPNEDYGLGRRSPYENNSQYRRDSTNLPYHKGTEKYISRYTDIDDILGTSGQIYSPFMDSILARRTGQIPFDDDECEEIDPTQVRIHDSTAQMPVIKKLRCRSEIIDYREEDQRRDVGSTVSTMTHCNNSVLIKVNRYENNAFDELLKLENNSHK